MSVELVSFQSYQIDRENLTLYSLYFVKSVGGIDEAGMGLRGILEAIFCDLQKSHIEFNNGEYLVC